MFHLVVLELLGLFRLIGLTNKLKMVQQIHLSVIAKELTMSVMTAVLIQSNSLVSSCLTILQAAQT